jgi:transcriptional regulator with XRE-family HTH domain
MSKKDCKAKQKTELLEAFQKALGDDLKARRDSNGMLQKEFVFWSGMPQSTVSGLEHGKYNATIGTLIELAITYKTSVVGVLRDPVFHINLG